MKGTESFWNVLLSRVLLKVFYGRVRRAEGERNNRKPLSLSSSLSFNCRVAGHQPLPPPPHLNSASALMTATPQIRPLSTIESLSKSPMGWRPDWFFKLFEGGVGGANAAARRRTPSSRRLWDDCHVRGGRTWFSCDVAADNETGCCLLLSPDSRESAWADFGRLSHAGGEVDVGGVARPAARAHGKCAPSSICCRQVLTLPPPRQMHAGLHPHTHEGQDVRLPQSVEPSSTRRRQEGDEDHFVSSPHAELLNSP